jgi:hypothetical protein
MVGVEERILQDIPERHHQECNNIKNHRGILQGIELSIEDRCLRCQDDRLLSKDPLQRAIEAVAMSTTTTVYSYSTKHIGIVGWLTINWYFKD